MTEPPSLPRITGPQWAALRSLPASAEDYAPRPLRTHNTTLDGLAGLGLADHRLDPETLKHFWRRTERGDAAVDAFVRAHSIAGGAQPVPTA